MDYFISYRSFRTLLQCLGYGVALLWGHTNVIRCRLLVRASPKRGCVFRIFVVDDSAQARSALKRRLEQRSEWVVVGEAYNGRHALATFLDHAPDL